MLSGSRAVSYSVCDELHYGDGDVGDHTCFIQEVVMFRRFLWCKEYTRGFLLGCACVLLYCLFSWTFLRTLMTMIRNSLLTLVMASLKMLLLGLS